MKQRNVMHTVNKNPPPPPLSKINVIIWQGCLQQTLNLAQVCNHIPVALVHDLCSIYHQHHYNKNRKYSTDSYSKL